jgi:hypothetical protein
VTRIASGLDTQDLVVEWTPEGKKPAMQILAPTGRLDANRMVDHPYTRHGNSEETQNQIVLTLIRQER